MKHLFNLSILLGAFLLFAETPNPTVFVGNDDGIGARGISMAGANTALTSDYSALFWNPAGLVNLKQHEFSLSLCHMSYSDASSYDNGPLYRSSISDYKLHNIGFVYPFPTRQGSLVAALGYSRPTNLEGIQLDESSLYQTKGYLSRWEGGLGIDLSRDISIGMAGFINKGSDNAELRFTTPDLSPDNTVYDKLADLGSFFGFGLNSGLLYRITDQFRLGLSSELYNSTQVERSTEAFLGEENVKQGSGSYTFISPLKIRGGIAYQTIPFCLEFDLSYTDWPNSYYYPQNVRTPFYLDSMLVSTLDFSVGTEVLLPLPAKNIPGVKLRLGFGHYQIPNPSSKSDNGKNEITGGISLLLDNALLFEVAAKASKTEFQYLDMNQLIHQTIETRKIFLTFSYRY